MKEVAPTIVLQSKKCDINHFVSRKMEIPLALLNHVLTTACSFLINENVIVVTTKSLAIVMFVSALFAKNYV
jgi:hypothetical protein